MPPVKPMTVPMAMNCHVQLASANVNATTHRAVTTTSKEMTIFAPNLGMSIPAKNVPNNAAMP